MRHILIMLVALLTCTNVSAAHLPVVWGVEGVINKVADLPKTEEYSDKDGKHYDLGTLHTEFSLFFLSVYIIDEPKLVYCDEDEEYYIELSEDETNAVLEENDLNGEELCKIGFFTRYGGKIIYGIIILYFVYVCIKPSKESKNKINKEDENRACS